MGLSHEGMRPASSFVQPEPVATTHPDHPRMARTLLGGLQSKRAEVVESLATHDVEDFAEYRFLRGQIAGLDIAISFAKEVQAKLES